VEVKYRKVKEENRILEIARNLRNNYGPTYLFVATPDAFYFDSCMSIIEKGYIDKLFESWIPRDVQEKYLKLLNEFIPK